MNITASKIIDDTETGKPKLWKMEIGDDPQKLGEYLLSLQKMIQRNPSLLGVPLDDNKLPVIAPNIPRLYIHIDESDLSEEVIDTLRTYGVKRLARCPDDTELARATFDPQPPDEMIEVLNHVLLETSKDISENVVDTAFKTICDHLQLHPRIWEAIQPIFWVINLKTPQETL
jgi:hypothetical protein